MNSLLNIINANWMYALILAISICGLVIIDWRLKLVAFDASSSVPLMTPRLKATLATCLCLVGFFLLWDISGIVLGIFSTNARYTLGLNLFSPNLPLEEIVFLCMLVYVSLIVYFGMIRLYPRLISKSDKS